MARHARGVASRNSLEYPARLIAPVNGAGQHVEGQGGFGDTDQRALQSIPELSRHDGPEIAHTPPVLKHHRHGGGIHASEHSRQLFEPQVLLGRPAGLHTVVGVEEHKGLLGERSFSSWWSWG